VVVVVAEAFFLEVKAWNKNIIIEASALEMEVIYPVVECLMLNEYRVEGTKGLRSARIYTDGDYICTMRGVNWLLNSYPNP